MIQRIDHGKEIVENREVFLPNLISRPEILAHTGAPTNSPLVFPHPRRISLLKTLDRGRKFHPETFFFNLA